MTKQLIKPLAARRIPPPITAAAWVFAIGAPALVLHAARVQAARREAEGALLAQVATMIKSPTAGREEVMDLLARRQRELSDARYVRVCNRLGMPMDWNTLFSQVARRGKDEQARAAAVIAEECAFAPGANLKQEQMALALRVLRGAGIERTVPIPERLRRSID